MIFVEAISKYGTMISGKLVAAEYVDRWVNRDRYYPGYHDLSTRQFRFLVVAACAELGIPCPEHGGHPGVPPLAVARGAGGRGMPSLMGLLMFPCAGLLHPGEPEEAYRHAFEIDYMDFGYARDGVGLMAAIVAAGLGDGVSARDAIERGLAVDPLGLGGKRTMVERLNEWIGVAREAKSDRDCVMELCRRFKDLRLHAFDPIDVLGLPVAACYCAEGDPKRAILMAVNDRDMDDQGAFAQYRDIDCTGSVCGALAGALAPKGIDSFPADWVDATLSANKEVYGFDILKNAERVYGVLTARGNAP
jgi:hypothetical protein